MRPFSSQRRTELIERFNTRASLPEAYIGFESKLPLSLAFESAYDVNISAPRVGHGALVLAKLDTSQDTLEAIPFALDPEHAVNPRNEDFIFGFHKYVAREVAEEFEGADFTLDTTLNMWHIEDNKVIALLRGGGGELLADEVDPLQRLSLVTPEVIYATKRLEDDSRLKILGGRVLARAIGEATWSEVKS